MAFRAHKNQRQIIRTKNANGKKVLAAVLVVVLLIGSNAGLFLWQQRLVREANQQLQQEQEEKEALANKVQQLEDEIHETTSRSSQQVSSQLDAEAVEVILAEKNYNNLQQYLADEVMVVLAASEQAEFRTASEAISDLAILDNATTPWDFAIPAATLQAWRSGEYRQYFPAGVLAGVSANGYVITMQEKEGRIHTIFVSPDVNLL